MANYPKELTDLVEEYLTDGIISAKERQVLLRKAEKLGVDVDEFDLYIDAQQQKVDQTIDVAMSKKRGSVCPYCGGPVPQLAEQCPHCGQFITAEASEELKEIIENLENALVDFKAGKDIDRSKAVVDKYSRKAKMYYSSNPKIKAILSEVEIEVSAANATARRRGLINGTIKNSWFWAGLPIVLGGLLMLIGFTFKIDSFLGVGFVIGILGIGALVFTSINREEKEELDLLKEIYKNNRRR